MPSDDIVHVASVRQAQAALRELAIREPENLRRDDALKLLVPEINAVLERGHTIDDVVESLQGAFRGLQMEELKRILRSVKRDDRRGSTGAAQKKTNAAVQIRNDIGKLDLVGEGSWRSVHQRLRSHGYQLEKASRGWIVKRIRQTAFSAPFSTIYPKGKRIEDLNHAFNERIDDVIAVVNQDSSTSPEPHGQPASSSSLVSSGKNAFPRLRTEIGQERSLVEHMRANPVIE